MSISTSDFDKPKVMGSMKTRRVKFDITSYSSEEGVSASDVGLKKLDSLELLGQVSDNGHVWEWDQANKQIKAFEPTGSHTHTENTEASYTQNATTESASGSGSEASASADVGALWVRAYGK